MGNPFDVYLRYMLLISLSIIGLFIVSFLLIRKRRMHSLKEKNVSEINNGSLGVFFDKNQNVTVIPYVKDKYGVGRAMSSVNSIRYPYSKEKLGSTLRDCMLVCKEGIPCTDVQLMKQLGFNGWKEFAEGKRNISVNYKEGRGIIFCPTTHAADGAYYFHSPSSTLVLPGTAEDELIGEVLLNLLPNCRLR
ncbi:MAG: hypothetical protein K0R31_1532 [Clostridiales bacterium]|jgi:hypothetical protein|nr:hypothetical protein [Clostridiales bacterium]